MRIGATRCGLILLLGAVAFSTDGLAQTPANAAAGSVPSAAQSSAIAPIVVPPTPAATALRPATGAGPSAVAPSSDAPRNLAGTISVLDPGAMVVAPDKTAREPKIGEKIYEGDAIVTKTGEMHIDMADGGYIAIRPNTQMRVSQYQANGDSEDKSVLGLIRGSFRSITGFIGHNNPTKYSILTPTATIGVRGTDHEPAYVPEGTPGQDAGTYDNVHAGGTTISNAAGKVDVTPDHAGFVDFHRNAPPRLLEHVPTFFQMPHPHDNLLVGKHDRVMATLDQKRTQRIQEHQQEIRNAPLSRNNPRQETNLAAQRRELPKQAATREALARPALSRAPLAREPLTRETLAGREAQQHELTRPALAPGLANRATAPAPAAKPGGLLEQFKANMAARQAAAQAERQTPQQQQQLQRPLVQRPAAQTPARPAPVPARPAPDTRKRETN